MSWTCSVVPPWEGANKKVGQDTSLPLTGAPLHGNMRLGNIRLNKWDTFRMMKESTISQGESGLMTGNSISKVIIQF